MMNVKETLKKLHKKFPLMSLDELFEILDCYTNETLGGSSIWTSSPLTCAKNETQGSITATLNDITNMYDNGTTTTIKNYANSSSVQLNGHN